MATITVPRSARTVPTARHELSNPAFQALTLARPATAFDRSSTTALSQS